jgi:lipopolysaccharide heptosyltransferase I
MIGSFLRTKQFERILLIKPSAFGDVLHTIPLLVKLRQRYPAARIDWLITPENSDVVRCHPALSNVVLFPRKDLERIGRSWPATVGFCRMVHRLWNAHYDLVIDMHGQFRSALLTWATAAPVRIGFDRPRRRHGVQTDRTVAAYRHGWTGAREGSWLAYSHRIPIPTLDVHAVDRYLWLGPLLGLTDGPPDFRIHIPPEAEVAAERLLKTCGFSSRPFAALFPGTIWPTKHWHVEGFAEVGRHLLQTGRAVVLCGSKADREPSRLVASACPGAIDLTGKTTIAEIVALVRRAAVCVTNDSGPMHLAVSLDRPVVSVFGPTDAVWIGPYGRREAVVRADLACSPCYLRQIHHCPNEHACMKQVTAGMVIDRLEKILAGGDSTKRVA